MRRFLSTVVLLIVATVPCRRLTAQSTAAPPATRIQGIDELRGALIGSWAGTLEYRDYSEPATSTKRVKLPTWLSIEPAGTDLSLRYVYDDGPAKTVTETSLVRIDSAASSYAVLDQSGKIEDTYAIGGLGELRQGRGILTLTGTGTENNSPVAVRTTVRIGRNILEITRETAFPGHQPFNFRHAYTLVRAVPRASAPGEPVR